MTLSDTDIISRLSPKAAFREERIVVTPILDTDDQISSSGIDLRLGTQFIIFKTHLHGSLNPGFIKSREVMRYQEEIVINTHNRIILHPGQFILGSTLEYICLPGDIEARIDGRSSWARMGLLIATATTIHPYYQGIITLELTNHGSIPIELYPGLLIVFMKFNRLSKKASYKEKDEKYTYAIGPGYTKIYLDKNLSYFTKGVGQN